MNLACAACRSSIGPGHRFCAACGAPVAAPGESADRFESPLSYTPPHLVQRILTSRSALEGERKRVSVLFCDIADSTVLAERLGEERMHELLNRYFEIALDEVHRYEGSVNQFLGDGFMALFGAPLALEHHERHAILAGLGVRQRLASEFTDAAQAAGMPFRVRIGINTGTVVVGKIGDNLRMDYTAVGDTTHVAARLQSMAVPGEMLIAKATQERAGPWIDTVGLGPLPIKGKSLPLEVHRVVGLRSAAAATQALSGRRLSRFVGREDELAMLLDSLDQAASGQGRAIGIVSEPGMGKTRLLWEFRQRIEPRGVAFLEGQCLSHGRSMPYLPILDILRAACRIADIDVPEVQRDKVHAALRAVGMDADADTPHLLHVMGLPQEPSTRATMTPEGQQARTFETLRQLLVMASRRQPLVLLIEDLHWADRSSQAFIASMVASLADAAVLFIATYRPGSPPAWAQAPFARQFELQPLPPSLGLEIARGVLVSLSGTEALPAAAAGIVERAEGNPLFLEELARAAGERPEAADGVPDTLLGVLAARLDRLPDAAKHLLQIASVIGREFSSTLLARLWDEATPIDVELDRLTRLEFIHCRTPADAATFAFKHGLSREVAYASLLASRRRACHGQVGLALEQVHADRLDEATEMLAHQFGHSAFDDKAVDYAVRAAGRAQRRWANPEALAFFELAQQRLAGMPASADHRARTIDVVLGQAEVRFALGQHAAQLEALRQIGPQIASTDDPARRAAWHYWMGFLTSFTGGPAATSIDHCGQASAIASEAALEDLQASSDACLAQVHLIAGDLQPALDIGERALEVFERQGNRWWACRTLSQLIPAANALGLWSRGLTYCDRAMAHGIAMDDLRLKASALIRLASTQIQRGDWQAGLQCCEQAQALAPVQYDAAALRAVRGYGLIKAGRPDEGRAELEAALTWYDRAHLRFTQTLFSTWLAEGWMRSRAVDQALPLLQGLHATCAEFGYRFLLGVTHRMLAECLQSIDGDAATAHLRQAVILFEAIDARNELAKTWLVATSFPNGLVEPGRNASLRADARAELQRLGTLD
ncbi:AAA family ATPase [Ideonella sp. A 288]|uniref:ATP-binding protein n=1 Tax=Ideonella sp. A 288 TaxID=1962181 RepID=UPI000B4BFE95|nr:adenylate/guanylate cyclase domain-containing protein [Ideonella sp. A 288]